MNKGPAMFLFFPLQSEPTGRHQLIVNSSSQHIVESACRTETVSMLSTSVFDLMYVSPWPLVLSVDVSHS